jgi:tetratricopeptide (TPR) repeat protein
MKKKGYKKISFGQKAFLVFFGLLLGVIALEIGLRIGGFILSSLQEHKNRLSLKQNNEYLIMCLGESTTAFGGISSWPSQLEEILYERNKDIRFKVINKGIPGANSALVLSQLDKNIKKYNPNMIITMLGINDGRDSIAYIDAPRVRTKLFFMNLRIYKLPKLLWLHIVNKVKEMSSYRVEKVKKEIRPHSSGNLLAVNNDIVEENYDNPMEILLQEDDNAYVNLGFSYNEQERYSKSEAMSKKALGINPNSYVAYTELGHSYKDQGEYQEAEAVFKELIALNPLNGSAYQGLGSCYFRQHLLKEAEAMFKKVLEINANDESAYRDLGICYSEQQRYQEAEAMLKKALEISAGSYSAYLELARFYNNPIPNKLAASEEMLKKALVIKPKSCEVYAELGRCYSRQERYEEAERMFKKSIEIEPFWSISYIGLEECNRIQGKESENRRMYKNFIYNYRKIKEIITQRGIKLLCVQYPMRSIEPLKNIFESQEGVILVDNEKMFKDALRNANYNDYFSDKFGGDFGHATPKGNRILAENIANVILEKVFKK